jgi:hypothetical protein
MADADKTHRWLTQAELNDMLQDSYLRGLNESAWLLAEARVRMPAACVPVACNGDGVRACCLSARIDAFLSGVDKDGGVHE